MSDEDYDGAPKESNLDKRPKRSTRNNGEPSIDSPLPTYPTRSTIRDEYSVDTDDPLGEAASMILCRIDSEKYEKAVIFDTERILRRHVFPKSFVWNKPRAQLLRTLPRDIEDMPGILHAGRDMPFNNTSTNEGPFGFGMFDMGGIRRKDVKVFIAETILSSPRSPQNNTLSSPHDRRTKKDSNGTPDDEHDYPLKSSIDFQAAARRSLDPRFIDLVVKLPRPTSLESALLNCQKHCILPRDPWLKHSREEIRKAKMLIEAERAELLSSMPMYWEKLDKRAYFHSPAFSSDEESSDSDLEEKRYESCLDAAGITIPDKDALFKASKQRNERKRKCNILAQSCFRKWRISVKVGSVSSRSSLVKETPGDTDNPMHLVAAFPDYIQFGQTVTIEKAERIDAESGFYLGSYDCRASAPHASMSYQAMRNVKKELRAKRNINIGRTRLIWSSFHQAANNKIVFTSDLTGEKLIAESSKRPLEAKVFIKLNGKVLSSTSPKIEKAPTNGQRVRTPPLEKIKWKDQDILEAIRQATGDKGDDDSDHELVSPPKEHYLYCTLDPEEYLKSFFTKIKLPPSGKKRKSAELGFKGYDHGSPIPMKFGGTNILKHIPPKFSCLPLDDGYVRVSCETPGRMEPSPVHDLLKSAAQQGTITPSTKSSTPQTRSLCSVCWSGDETHKLITCSYCGLMVHEDCCTDTGEYTSNTESASTWKCSVCRDAHMIPEDSIQNASSTDNSCEDQGLQPSRKSRRTSRLPTRFNEDNTVIDASSFPRQANSQQTNGTKKERLSPKCVLCPHSGGAMSALNEGGGNNRWVHEICRIWCPIQEYNDLLLSKSSTLPSSTQTTIAAPPLNEKHLNPKQVCCLCGTVDSSSHPNQKGLIKCAATGCTVMFHPMCATLATKLKMNLLGPPSQSLAETEPNIDYYGIRDDIEKCQEYTLDLVEVTHEKIKENRYNGLYVKRAMDMIDSNRKSKSNSAIDGRMQIEEEEELDSIIVPVAFCGIHNPKRNKSFYGCTPGAELMAKFIKIPFQK